MAKTLNVPYIQSSFQDKIEYHIAIGKRKNNI